MFRYPRSLREVLADRSGSGVVEGLGGIALLIIVIGALTAGIGSHVQAITAIAAKAERQSMVAALVGDEYSSTWGTPTTPKTATMTLPNGHQVPVTTWREETASSVRLTAVSPISAGTDAATCSGPSSVAKTGCTYASRVHAKDVDRLSPNAVARKHPGMTGPVVGTVDARVSTSASLPQGAAIAQFRPTAPAGQKAVLRYLLAAAPLDRDAEIAFIQNGDTLATVRVGPGTNSYFGTFTASTASNVTAQVSSGNAVVTSVFVYTAGSTR